MADGTTSLAFPISAGDQLAEISWSTIEHVEMQNETFFMENGLMAKDVGREDVHKRRPGVPIILKDELKKGPGDEVRIRLRRQLTNTNRTSTAFGITSMLGAEETLVFMDVSIWLSLLKNSVGHNSPDLNYHRTSIDMEDDSELALKEWMVENYENSMIDAFYDKYPYQTIQDISGATSTPHPREFFASGAENAGAMGPSNILTAAEVLRMRSYFINRKLNPVRAMGKKAGCVLADTFVLNDLRRDDDYKNAQGQGNVRGSGNPLIDGSIGDYNDLYFYEYERMRRKTSGPNAANIGQILLLGADALAVAMGSEPRIVARTETNYGDRWGRAIRQVFGATRCDFQTQDNNTTLNQSSAQWDCWEERDEFAA